MLLDDRFQVGGSINHGSLRAKADTKSGKNEDDENDDSKVNLDNADIKATSVEGHLKWFPLNSLYATGGGSYRTVSSEVTLSDKDESSNKMSTKTNARAVCLDVEPDQLPVALVNRYLDIKRSGRL